MDTNKTYSGSRRSGGGGGSRGYGSRRPANKTRDSNDANDNNNNNNGNPNDNKNSSSSNTNKNTNTTNNADTTTGGNTKTADENLLMPVPKTHQNKHPKSSKESKKQQQQQDAAGGDSNKNKNDDNNKEDDKSHATSSRRANNTNRRNTNAERRRNKYDEEQQPQKQILTNTNRSGSKQKHHLASSEKTESAATTASSNLEHNKTTTTTVARGADGSSTSSPSHVPTSAGSGSHGHHHHHQPPSSKIVDAVSSNFTFPSDPPTLDQINTGAAVGGGGGNINTAASATSASLGGATNTSASISRAPNPLGARLDPGNAFPNAPFRPVGNLSSGAILKNYLHSSQNAVTTAQAGTSLTASPKFAHYSALTLLEAEARQSSLMPTYQTQVYRSSNRFSGSLVCIRRVVSCPSITPERCAAVSDTLRQFRHPNLAQLNSVIATTEFNLGSNDVLLEYRYVKAGRSLQEIINSREELTESCIWSIACQLISLVRHFHESETPLRGLHATKLLLVQDMGDGYPSNSGGAQRVIFTGLGLVDVLGTTDVVPPTPALLAPLLHADIIAVGNILYQLIHSSLNVDRSVNVEASPLFTPALFALIRACRGGGDGTTTPTTTTTITQLCRALGDRMASEMSNQIAHGDYLLGECAKEIHNGRLMKLLMRLNFAYSASQPYQDYDTLFIVRLFYQYLFSQVDEHGTPQFDWGLVYHGLNKLDCQSEDLVQLVSEQDHTLFVVSYKDVARCIEVMCDGMLQPGGRDHTGGITMMQQQQILQQQQAQQQGVATAGVANANNTNAATGGGLPPPVPASQQQATAAAVANAMNNLRQQSTGGTATTGTATATGGTPVTSGTPNSLRGF